ncbi:MAG: hypothetical protein KF764_23865 [Labilithrix sp.]|nr:hypothetical protein [Labilithrix sp.]
MSTHARRRSSDAAQPTVPAPPASAHFDDASQGPTTRRVDLREPARDGDDDARPTTVPAYDVEALAAASSWEGALPPATRAPLPLDLAVPVRRRASVDGAPLRAAFLLSHVDERMSITEIAATAQIPVADAVESFVLLADLGVVELRGVTRLPSDLGASPPEGGGAADRPSLLVTPADSARPRPPTPKSGLRRKT